MPSKPIAWVLPKTLAVGSLPMVEQLPDLAEQGMRAIVSLCYPDEGTLPPETHGQFSWVQFPLPDSHKAMPLEPDLLGQAVDWVHQSITNHGATYVHCLAVIERSPTVCIAYLCRYRGMALWEALNWLKEVHPRTAPTSLQLRAITSYLEQALDANRNPEG